MRDEWQLDANTTATTTPPASNDPSGSGRECAQASAAAGDIAPIATSRSSQGLTRQLGGLDRSASLNLAARAMKLKIKPGKSGSDRDQKVREVSERRQVGDAEDVVNPTSEGKAGEPWWKNVTMEEGM